MRPTYALFFAGALVASLAAAAAFLITWGEYAHHYPDKRRVLRTAVQAAAFTFFVFLGLALMLALVLPKHV